MIAVCMSSYREGEPMLSGAHSALRAGDFLLIDDSPIGDAPAEGDPSPVATLAHMGSVYVSPSKPAASDAEKRTRMLRRARTIANERGRHPNDRLWLLWLDGDELLLWPELLPDLCYRVSFETGAGGFPLRIVELDGSVALSYGKVIDANAVERYEHSSYQVRLVSGLTVALPNVKICGAGGIPAVPSELWEKMRSDPDAQEEAMAHHRPPLAGEPHILHRSILRSPERQAERQSTAESRWFTELLGPDGQVLKEIPR